MYSEVNGGYGAFGPGGANGQVLVYRPGAAPFCLAWEDPANVPVTLQDAYDGTSSEDPTHALASIRIDNNHEGVEIADALVAIPVQEPVFYVTNTARTEDRFAVKQNGISGGTASRNTDLIGTKSVVFGTLGGGADVTDSVFVGTASTYTRNIVHSVAVGLLNNLTNGAEIRRSVYVGAPAAQDPGADIVCVGLGCGAVARSVAVGDNVLITHAGQGAQGACSVAVGINIANVGPSNLALGRNITLNAGGSTSCIVVGDGCSATEDGTFLLEDNNVATGRRTFHMGATNSSTGVGTVIFSENVTRTGNNSGGVINVTSSVPAFNTNTDMPSRVGSVGLIQPNGNMFLLLSQTSVLTNATNAAAGWEIKSDTLSALAVSLPITGPVIDDNMAVGYELTLVGVDTVTGSVDHLVFFVSATRKGGVVTSPPAVAPATNFTTDRSVLNIVRVLSYNVVIAFSSIRIIVTAVAGNEVRYSLKRVAVFRNSVP